MATTAAHAVQSAYDSYHQKVFLDAVRCGDTLRLRRLLETDYPGEGGRETQQAADLRCRSTTNARLVDIPVNVNVYASDGQTALHQSCRTGNLELVKLLVRHGADVRLANRDGWSALHIAVGAGHQDVARFLLRAYRR